MKRKFTMKNFKLKRLAQLLGFILLTNLFLYNFEVFHNEILRRIKQVTYPPYEGDIFSVGPYRLYDFYPPGFLKKELPPQEIQKIRKLFGRSFGQIKDIANRLRENSKKLKVSIIIPTHEGGAPRLLSKEETSNDLSVNSLRIKIYQLKELLDKYSDVINWEIAIGYQNPGKTLPILKEAISKLEQDGLIKNGQVKIVILSEVGKGQGVIGAIKRLLEEENPPDIFVYTDNDISTDLRQLGILLGPMMNSPKIVGIGVRDSNIIKSIDYPVDEMTKRIDETIREVTRPLMRVLLKPIMVERGIKDTQLGFKAYSREAVEKIFPSVQLLEEDKGLSFDTELMLQAIKEGYELKKEVTFWVDTPGGSALNVKLRWGMLLGFVTQYERLVVGGGLGEKTINDDQVAFLKEYIMESIKRIDEGIDKDIEDQLKRWRNLREIIKGWGI